MTPWSVARPWSVRGDSPGKNTGVGCHAFPRSPTLQVHSLPSEPPRKPKNTGVGSLSLLQRIFLIQGSNPGLPHCRQILYCLSHQGSPKILEWVVYPFSRGSSWSRNWTAVSCLLYQLSYQGRSIPKSSGIFKSSFILIYQKHLPSLSLAHWLLLINFLRCILFIFPTLFPLSFPYSQITFLLLNPLPRCFYPFAWVK